MYKLSHLTRLTGLALGLASAQPTLAESWVQVLQDEKATKWGTWRAEHTCPRGEATSSFRLRAEDYQGNGDDTGVNGLGFRCHPFPSKSDPRPHHEGYIEEQGIWGTWTDFNRCRNRDVAVGLRVTYLPDQGYTRGDGATVGFGLRQFPSKVFSSWGIYGDDVGIFNVELVCRNFLVKFSKEDQYLDTNNPLKRKEFLTNPAQNAKKVTKVCPPEQFMTGFIARIEPRQGGHFNMDDAAMTNVKIRCSKKY